MRTGIRRGIRLTLAGLLLSGGLATFSLAVIGALTAGTASAVGPLFSSTTPGTYTVIVPEGVASVTITAVGGSGGSDIGDNIAGGEGGIITQNASVTPGESLTVTVGANGHCTADIAGCDALGGSGYGSGGNGLTGAGGAGGSAVVDNGTVIVVAGGGGGAGSGSGEAIGGNADQGGAGFGGNPGTLSGPGGGACVFLPHPSCALPGIGTNGGSGGNGAGGGGFFGGGAGVSGGLGGSANGGGGGGGASYPAPSTQWDATATPSVTISANPNPTTSVLIPSNGATLSGSTYLDASATNATSVEFRLFGGIYGYSAPVLCTATLTYYGWLCSWNTTTVPNGTYALVSLASNSVGNAASSGVSITVGNPPTTSVLIPSNGATLSGGTYLDASASNATNVEFRLFGGIYGYNAPVVCTATPTIYGWLCGWNTTTVPNGSYVLASEAFNSGGSTFSSGVIVTVANAGLGDLASSSVAGTSSALTSCNFAGVTFNAAYSGSGAVGTVTLRMNGCIPDTGPNFPFIFEYSGTFSVTTGVGTLSGSVDGKITNVNLSPPPEINLEPTSATLTLTATSGTGDFMETTGTLNASFQWPEPGSSTFIGTVTAA